MKFEKVVSLPIIGTLFGIANSYVSGGNFESDTEIAPIKDWGRVIGIPFLLAATISFWMVYPNITEIFSEKKSLPPLGSLLSDPGSLLVGILPNVLGFGIGVYALVFSISNGIVKEFNSEIQNKNPKKSVLALNADMAFPLMALLLAISYGLIIRKAPENLLAIMIGWTALWYSLILTLGVIGTLFRLGEQELLDKM